MLRSQFYYTIPYCGKSEVITDAYIRDTLTLVKRIIERCKQNGYPLRLFNISMDRFYNSRPLARWIYSKHIACIGTIQTNRKKTTKSNKRNKRKRKK